MCREYELYEKWVWKYLIDPQGNIYLNAFVKNDNKKAKTNAWTIVSPSASPSSLLFVREASHWVLVNLISILLKRKNHFMININNGPVLGIHQPPSIPSWQMDRRIKLQPYRLKEIIVGLSQWWGMLQLKGMMAWNGMHLQFTVENEN